LHAETQSFFPLLHGFPRVDDRQVMSGIMFVIRNGLADHSGWLIGRYNAQL